MARISKSLQAFQRVAGDLNRGAQQSGKNVNKRQVASALKLMTNDGRVSVADAKAAATFLDSTPLTRGAREALNEFIANGTGWVDSDTGQVSPWQTRLSTGGGESSSSSSTRPTTGGGESATSTPATGGGESSSISTAPAPRPSTGGGESSSTSTPAPSPSTGGGESSSSGYTYTPSNWGSGGGSWGGGE